MKIMKCCKGNFTTLKENLLILKLALVKSGICNQASHAWVKKNLQSILKGKLLYFKFYTPISTTMTSKIR